jgi:transcriptional regulator GlxA family with amidase domain
MALLRKLRMRRAANLLTAETFSIEQIATLAVTPAAAVSREFPGNL